MADMKALLFWFGGFLSTIMIFLSFLVGLMCGYDVPARTPPGRYSNPSYKPTSCPAGVRRTTNESEHST